MHNNIIPIDANLITEKEKTIQQFEELSGEGNSVQYQFSIKLARMLDLKSCKSWGQNQTDWLNELAANPNIHYNDGGHLRQVAEVGKMIINDYQDNPELLLNISFSNATIIARASLVPAISKMATTHEKEKREQNNKQAKRELVDQLINGDLESGKLKARICQIKLEHSTDLMKMIDVYNQWSYSKIDPRFGMQHNGQIPGQIILNTIYHFTHKGASILDPMAGGGTTHDVCDWINRSDPSFDLTCTSFDLCPRKEHDLYTIDEDKRKNNYTIEKDRSFIIQKNVLTDDWDIDDLDLIFLDPPYYSMVADGYAKNDFTESLPSFYAAIDVLMRKSYDALKVHGTVALIMQPQTSKDIPHGENYIDLPYECMKIMEAAGFKPWHRVQVPLPTQQFLPQQVNKVKEYANRSELLGTARDLIIMKKIKR